MRERTRTVLALAAAGTVLAMLPGMPADAAARGQGAESTDVYVQIGAQPAQAGSDDELQGPPDENGQGIYANETAFAAKTPKTDDPSHAAPWLVLAAVLPAAACLRRKAKDPKTGGNDE